MSQQSPAPQPESNAANADADPGVIVYLFVILVFAAVIWGVYRAYSKYIAAYPAVISMSAYFVDKDDKVVTSGEASYHALRIQGTASRGGAPLKDGTVRLAVSTEDGQFLQSVSTPLKGGNFESKDPTFSSLLPDAPIQISALVSAPDLSEAVSEEIFLNMTQPALSRTMKILLWLMLGILPLALLGVFFGAFTGTKTPKKNRVAIILSYCIIGLFLAIPLLAPVLLLYAFPDAQQNMIDAPVGLVITPIGKPRDGESEEDLIQWAVNIGGFSRPLHPAASDQSAVEPVTKVTPTPTPLSAATPARPRATLVSTASTPAVQPSPAATPAVSPAATPQPTVNAAASPAPSVQQPVAGAPTPARPAATPGQVNASASPSVTPVVSPETSSGPAGQLAPSAKPRPRTGPGEFLVKVTGGLVIPLYVIILSVIGGAINMTRKVPRFQREGEYSEFATPGISFKWAMKILPGSNKSSADGSAAIPQVSGADAPVPNPQPGGPQNPSGEPPQATVQQVPSAPATPAVTPATVSPAEATDTEADEIETLAKAQRIDGKVDELVRQQTQRSSETQGTMSRITELVQEMGRIFESKKADERILGYSSFEDWLGSRTRLKELLGSNWRVELLYQYMYLIAAPFLAIVAYYMLDLMGLTKQPILVLISFSVGLISERILSWLLGVAAGYMRDSAPPSTP